MRIGVDVGGTFTDSVSWRDGQLTIAKVPSTKPQSEGVASAIEALGHALDDDALFFHGTTVGTNALIERDAGPAGLLVTGGFGDLLEIQRGDRPSLYDLKWQRPRSVIERNLVEEVAERLSANGEVVRELDEQSLIQAVDRLVEAGVNAIGVCFLFSYLNHTHERRAREIISERHPTIEVTLSSDIAAEWRELERANTVAVNAYLLKLMSTYLHDLRDRLRATGYEREYFVMQSSGGMLTSALAAELPFMTLLSGPAAGVQAAANLARMSGVENVLSLDMGGTSTDLCLIEAGNAAMQVEAEVDGLPLKVRSLAINAVGAGGGSVAYVDGGGRLRVGPRSAGAQPGPACYGKGGTEPTITDAACLAGMLDPEERLGGRIAVDPQLALSVIEPLGRQLGLSPMDTATAILKLAVDNIAHASRAATVSAGRDPRGLGLVAFGGAGPMVACAVADELGLSTVIIPPHPGVTSATGLLSCGLQYETSRTVPVSASTVTADELDRVYANLEARAVEVLSAEGFGKDQVQITRSVLARYEGQTHEVEMPITPEEFHNPGSLVEAFGHEHERRYTFRLNDRDVELITHRVTASVDLESMTLADDAEVSRVAEPRHLREVHFGPEVVQAGFYDRSDLPAGSRIHGPAIVGQLDTTTVIPPGFSGRVVTGNILLLTKVESA